MRHDSSVPPISGVAFLARLTALRPRTIGARARFAALSAAVAGGYFCSAKLVIGLLPVRADLEPIWLPAGVALAAVLLGGYRVIPALAGATLLVGLTTPVPLVQLLGTGAGSIVGAVAATAVLRRLDFRTSLARVRDVLAFILVGAILSTAVGAAIGVVGLSAAGALGDFGILGAWRVWWVSEMAGMLLAGSAILVLAGTDFRRLRAGGMARAALMTSALACAGVVVLRHWGPSADLILPILFVLALLYRQDGAAIGGFLILGTGVWLTAGGHVSAIASGEEFDRMQILVAIGSTMSLLVAAGRTERHIAETALRRLAQSEQALAHQASHDALTGLPNRTVFLDRLEIALARAKRSRRKLAVFFLDLDDFKLVNDTRGHESGDLLLRTLTPRLSAALRPGDTIARFGGDEFVVLCEDLASDEDAITIAQRMSRACARPIVVGSYEHSVTVSAGVVVVDDGAATPSDVLRDADAAMYRAKAAGKGGVEVFDERQRERLLERMAIEADLRGALESQQFRLFYQPVVSTPGGEVVRVEALLRWQHPGRGLLAPAHFIPIAESSGLIVPIGEWVLREACAQALAWRDADPHRRGIPVSVNVSAAQFLLSDVAASIAAVLAATGLEPRLLDIEVNERVLADASDVTRRALREIKRMGIRLVLDDFGTGYSSLSNLNRFTIDALKIDRSFVKSLGGNPDSGAVVEAVVNMASALDVDVTAEGVETAEQLSRLREKGCTLAQGYLFSRPLPAESLPEMFSSPEDREPALV